MAYISVEYKTSTSVTLILRGLDTSWTLGTRTVNWYLGSANGGIPTSSAYYKSQSTTLSNGVSEGGTVTFNGLSASTEYGIYCEVYHNSTRLANLQGYVTTDAGGSTAVPKITSYSAYQISSGSMDIEVSLVGTNLIGYTVTLGLSYFDGTSMTTRTKVPITSDNFKTIITAESFDTDTLSIVFDPGGTYKKAYYIEIYMESVPDDTDYFEWSSAVAQGLPIKNVSHNEWNNFIDKIIEILTDKKIQNFPISEGVYGYSAGTSYLTMLKDCYLTYDSNYSGYPLTAKKFNVARYIIGSNVSTGISDKTSKTSKVLASDFIKLENCLKTWQDK